MIDLHSHSSASDGSFTPSEILREAVKVGLYATALTDHDTVSGLKEFEKAASELSYPNAVPGLELSVRIEDYSIHICGLFVDYSSIELCELLEWAREKRNIRNKKIISKLQGLGYKIELDEVLAVAKGESLGRPHIAKILVSKDYFKTPQDVFDKLLKRGEPAYVEREIPSPEEALLAISRAGGISVWAHPFARRNLDRRNFRETVSYMKSLGLNAIEAYYSTYDTSIQEYLLKVAEEENLLPSGGSDFHGTNMDGIKLGIGMGGLSIPNEVFDRLLELKNSLVKEPLAKVINRAVAEAI